MNSNLRIDVPVRLRRAIQDNDLPLVKRIVKNNPSYLQNPDFNDLSNTSLHLAAANGFLEIVEYLVSCGHETSKDSGLTEANSDVPEVTLSINAAHNSPLHLAASNSHGAVVAFLASAFPHCVNRPNDRGSTPLMLASESVRPPSSSSSNALVSSKATTSRNNAGNEVANTATLQALLENGADANATDHLGNTALHYASAWGNLKALRILVAAGAEPMAKNMYSWTPVSYSCTVQAEVYFKNFVLEFEKKKFGMGGTGGGKGGAGVRLVTEGEGDDEMEEEVGDDSFSSG